MMGSGGSIIDNGMTTMPLSAMGSGGPLTIPQGSAVGDIAPTLTDFERQSPDAWGNMGKQSGNADLMKMIGALSQGQQGQQPVVSPAPTNPMMAMGQGQGVGGIPRGGAGGSQASLPNLLNPQQIMTALQLIKARMGQQGGLGAQSNVPRF